MRNKLIAKLHIAKKDLGMTDDMYRDALQVSTGKRSAKDMTSEELEEALKHFERCGWKPKPKPQKGKKLSPKTRHLPAQWQTQVNKIRALWIEGYNRGIIRNRYEDALNAFVKRQTGIERIEWIRRHEDANKVIQALRKMIGDID
jgi:phage gp16-like protein